MSLLLIQGTSPDVGTSFEDLLTSCDASTQTDEYPTPNHEENDSHATIDYSYQASQSPRNNSSSSRSYTDVYELDNDCDGLAYPSQPVMGGKHGAYIPPGWKHRVVKRSTKGTKKVRQRILNLITIIIPLFYIYNYSPAA